MNIMTDLFSELFSSRGLSAEDIDRVSNEFSGMVFLYVLGASETKLNQEDINKIGELMDENRPLEALEVVRAKYTEDEWERMLQKEIDPLVQTYIKDVARK